MKKHASSTSGLLGRTASYLKDVLHRSFGGEQVVVPAQASWQRVAIVISHDKNMWAVAVVQRFVAALRDQFGYQNSPEVEILSAQGSAQQLRHVMSNLRSRQRQHHCYELVVTVGNWCSKEVRDVLDTWDNPLPQVFCPANDPVKFGLVDSLEHTGRDVSGVTSVLPDYAKGVAILQSLIPQIKTILVPFDPCSSDEVLGSVVSEHKNKLIQACENRDIAVRTLVVTSSQSLAGQICKELVGVDLVCTIPEPTIYACMAPLVAACNKARVPLCTAELSSVYQGAAIGFGERGDVYGPYAAAIVYDMLVNHRSLSSIPVIRLNHDPLVRFNQDALRAQGVQLSEQAQHLLSMTSIFHEAP